MGSLSFITGVVIWIDGDDETGAILTATGLGFVFISDVFFLRPAVKRYNRLVKEGKVPVPADEVPSVPYSGGSTSTNNTAHRE